MSEMDSHIQASQGSEKSFGVVFSIVFLIVFLYFLVNSGEQHIWALLISIAFLLLAFMAPRTLRLPNKLWFALGILLGSIVAPIVMVFIYFIAVLPTGLIMRLLGKDLLHQKLDKDSESYWVERDKPIGSMRNQF